MSAAGTNQLSPVPLSTRRPSHNNAGILDTVDDWFKKTRETIGNGIKKLQKEFNPPLDCRNGGLASADGCSCPHRFEGKLCEIIVCLNGGKPKRVQGKKGLEEVCSCEPQSFVSGNHCETISCASGSLLADGTGCQCDIWHFGRFCESPYLATFAPALIIGGAVLLALLFCCICRLDLCKRGSPPPRRTRRSNPNNLPPPDPHATRASLLNSGSAPSVAGDPARVTRYHVRLDTIPTFNPGMIAGIPVEEDPDKVHAPPSYEEALRTTSVTRLPPPKYEDNERGQGANAS